MRHPQRSAPLPAGMRGIGMGYHRLLTHRGYQTYRPVEYFLTWCGTLALEGGPIFWVATHRNHHQHPTAKAIRTRRAKAPGGARGMDPAGRWAPPRRRRARALRPRSRPRSRPRRAFDMLTDLRAICRHPRWSPDGGRLVFVVRSALLRTSIYVADATTGATRRVTSGAALEQWPTWSADGQSIYFASTQGGDWHVMENQRQRRRPGAGDRRRRFEGLGIE